MVRLIPVLMIAACLALAHDFYDDDVAGQEYHDDSNAEQEYSCPVVVTSPDENFDEDLDDPNEAS